MIITAKFEGVAELSHAMTELPKATRRNVLKRVLQPAAEPIAVKAAHLAPHDTGRLGFSIAVSPTLTRRHKGEKVSEVEMHIGPAGGLGALNYASFVEFGTVDTQRFPFMRVAWEGGKEQALDIIKIRLGAEVEKAAARLARRSFR